MKKKVFSVLVITLVSVVLASVGSSAAMESKDSVDNILLQTGYGEICTDIVNKDNIEFADKTLGYEYSFEIPMSKNFSVMNAVYSDGSGNEYRFYTNGELCLFSSDSGVSISEFSSDIMSANQKNGNVTIIDRAKQFVKVLLPNTDLSEYTEIETSSTNLNERVYFTKRADTPYAETITVAIFPNGSLNWIKNQRAFISSLTDAEVKFFDDAYIEYSKQLETNGSRIDSHNVYYQMADDGTTIAQYITIMKDHAGAYYTDVYVFELK